jgi:transmembrane sensor
MEDQRLKYLLEIYSSNRATDSEISELNKYLDEGIYEEQVKNFILNKLEENKGDNQIPREVSEDILSSIFDTAPKSSNINNPVEKNQIVLRNWKSWLTAAMIIFVIGFIAYPWLQPEVKESLAKQDSVIDFPPGTDQAMLTLWDGTLVQLNNVIDSTALHNAGLTINSSEGEIVSNSNSNSIGYNTLVTPLGGQYKIVLPDGSRAWLNAGSSIRFPTTFVGSERSVSISGEVYFEIQTNKQKPFIVQVKNDISGNDMEVKVLGTHFNISSYPDDPTINTTLVEGSIEVRKGATKKLLSAGQQARISNNSDSQNVLVETVDTESVIAWKDGVFEFNGNLQDILRQISRWYNVDVQYENEISNRAFIGTIARDNKISEVLKILELTGEVQFEIEENTVIVKPNNNLNP